MPRYEYSCDKCKELYDVYMTVKEFEEASIPKCPDCGKELQIQFGANIRWNTSGGTRGRTL